MQERRRFIRWQIARQAKVKLQGAENFANCQVKDINFKGVQISLGMKLPKDTFLKLCLALSDEFAINTEIWVVWHKSIIETNTYGLYFSKISDADKEKIYQFIRSNFPEELNKQWWKGLNQEEKGGEEMEDRRIFARFKANFPAKYFNLKENSEGKAQVQDLSAKGLCLVTKEQLQPNVPLEMWLEIPDKGEPLYTRGQVVWSRQEGVNACRAGICFDRADLMGLSRALMVEKN